MAEGRGVGAGRPARALAHGALTYGALAALGGVLLAALLALALGTSSAGAATVARPHGHQRAGRSSLSSTGTSGTDAGYSIAGSDGGVYSFGHATFAGSQVAHLAAPAVGVVTDPATEGYWVVAADGGVFAFNAPFYGSMAGRSLAAPIVGMAATPTGGGYWLVGADGGVFAFGSAAFDGSWAGHPLAAPIAGIAAAPGGGYWLVGADGGVFSFGPAAFRGSMGGRTLAAPVAGIAAAPGGGYWLVGADGGVFAFGSPFYGSTLATGQRVVALASTGDGAGYWEVTATGAVLAHGDAQTAGSVPGAGIAVDNVVGIAGLTLPPYSTPPPAITSLSPTRGATAGGTSVTITGTSFVTVTSVTFAGSHPSFTQTGTTLTVSSPAHAAGTVTVKVTTAFGTSAPVTYTYVAPPSITSLSPTKGRTAGDTTVVIIGTSFVTVTSVTFAGTHSMLTVSGTSLTVTAPAHAAGAVTVTVTTAFGTSAPATFTYVAPPTITSITPDKGPTGTVTTVTIKGSNFVTVTKVTFGGSSARFGRTPVHHTTLFVTAPAHAAGTVSVTVITAFGTSSGSTYTYVAKPTISSVSPTYGSPTGGTVITIHGTALTYVTAVYFTPTAAVTTFTEAGTTITVTSPAHAAGTVTLYVGSPGGYSNGERYEFVAPPVITTVSPDAGPTAGGTTVTIVGTNFLTVSGVTFGGHDVSFTATATALFVKAPAHAAGPVNVKVTTAFGTSVAATYTYVAPPTVITASPDHGPPAGGNTVTITGTNFAAVTSVYFGTTRIKTFTRTGTTITVKAPAHAAGSTVVGVFSPGGTSNGATYTYVGVPVISSLSPGAGPTTTAPVTIIGTGFFTVSAVTFGGTAVSYTVTSPNAVKVTAPAHAAGPVSVNVTTASGTSAPSTYRYLDLPTVSTVSPSHGPTAGGNTLTITGTHFTTVGTVYIGQAVIHPTPGSVAPTKIVVTAPPEATAVTATATVSVNNPAGTSTNGTTYTYVPAPSIVSIAPPSGPVAGNTTVTLTGTHLGTATTVVVGTTPIIQFTDTGTSISFTTPASGSGEVPVKVTTAGGTATITFLYLDAPTATTLSPTGGPANGGNNVTITGAHFDAPAATTTVEFGTTPATKVQVLSPTSLAVTAPSGTATTTVSVTVVTPGGTSPGLTYRYYPVPGISGVSPTAGPAAGGNDVTVAGSGFTTPSTVHFGTREAATVRFVSTTQLTVVAPTGAATSTVTVTVTTIGGQATAPTPYAYDAPPSITSIRPSEGPTTGGTQVTATGPHLAQATTVETAITPLAFTTTSGSTSVSFTMPGGPAGTATIRITTPGGTATTTFRYGTPPIAGSVQATAGPVGGGNIVTVSGTGFVAATTSVSFGANGASTVVVATAHSLTAKVPAGSAGPVDVTVTTPFGSGTLPGGYTYGEPPTVSVITPGYGPANGTTAVTIHGSNFTTPARVTFGGSSATPTTITSSSITLKTPPHSAGKVTVTVQTAFGTAVGGYTYLGPPTVSSVGPASGKLAGGTTLSVSGSQFLDTTGVTVGGTTATFTVSSTTLVLVTAPAATRTGLVDVVVTTPEGSAYGGYRYDPVPVITTLSPSTGTWTGGTEVTLSGSGFDPGTTVTLSEEYVTFGGTAITHGNWVSVTTTAIVLRTPKATTALTVTVRVITPGGTSAPSVFDYNETPRITGITPDRGLAGSEVTIHGLEFDSPIGVTFGGTTIRWTTTTYFISADTTAIVVKVPTPTPIHPTGVVTVTVTTVLGTSNPWSFQYGAPGPGPGP